MSDDKQLSGMVVCDHCPDFAHPLNDDGTKCINPRPASPTPEQPAQDGDRDWHEWEPDPSCAICGGPPEYRDHTPAALAPPAQTQQGLRARRIQECIDSLDMIDGNGHRMWCDYKPLEDDAACACKAPLNPDKQPSPSAAPSQEPESSKALRAALRVERGPICIAARCRNLSPCACNDTTETRCNVRVTPSTLCERKRWHDGNHNDGEPAPSPAQPASPEGALREALEKIVNASYTEFRPSVEHYGPDPTAEAHIYPGGVVHRSHATEQEWALARKVAGYLQGIASAALAGQPAREDDLPPICMEPVSFDVKGDPVDGSFSGTKPCAEPLVCPRHSAREDALVRDADGEVDMIASLRKGLEKRSAEDDRKALRAALGRIVAVVTSDDWLSIPDALEQADRALAGSPAGEGREDNQEQLGKKGGE